MKNRISLTLAILSLVIVMVGYVYITYYGIIHSNVVGMSAMGTGYVFTGIYILTTMLSAVFAGLAYLLSKEKLARKISKITFFILGLPIIAGMILSVVGSLNG